mmetsp:Transcript_9486/g.14529  ORF Transcript_9486/g.14529 Transcript_9486/m.14529 type:complete len:287 (+) Transcript_9486:92-952(+)
MNDDPKNAASRGRSLSRQILGNDFDLVNKYATKYNTPMSPALPAANQTRMNRAQTYAAMPNMSYGGYSGGYSTASSSLSSMNSSQRAKVRRQPSNLINASTMGQWDSNEVVNQEQDMSAAMNAMVSSYATRVNDDAAFLNEIEDEAEVNAEFGKAERAEEWSVKEVCYWLNHIHLDKYIKAFRAQIIDGSILLRDLDESILMNELGVKRLHVKKLLREITKLKNKSPKLKREINDGRDELIQSLRAEIDQLKEKNKTLTQELDIYKNAKQSAGVSVYSANRSNYKL